MLSCSTQLVLVLTDSTKATKGQLYCFERNRTGAHWQSDGRRIPVVLGRNGLAWGHGLHTIPAGPDLPVKVEGDGCSPAGVFRLGTVFGHSPEIPGLKMPYIQVTEMTECVDDQASRYYNRIVARDENDSVDWTSSEKMYSMGIYYQLGVIIEHNYAQPVPGGGSCILLHNWADPDETMAGCTALAPENMLKLVHWLDEGQQPVFVQLTVDLYRKWQESWALPLLPD